MRVPDLNILRSNLDEIYYALHVAHNSKTSSINSSIADLNLFANSKSHIYNSQSFFGRSRLFVRTAFRYCLGSFQEFPLNEALEFIITELFHAAVKNAYKTRRRRIEYAVHLIAQSDLSKKAFSQNDRLQALKNDLSEELGEIDRTTQDLYLKQHEETKSLNEDDIRDLRWEIKAFHEATNVFWSFIISDLKRKERKPVCEPIMSLIQHPAWIQNSSYRKALVVEGKLTFFEGVLKQSIPYVALAKLDDPLSLTVSEKRLLENWIEGINTHEALCSSEILTIVLLEVIRVLTLYGIHTVSLFDIVHWLDKHGCRVVRQDDPKQMEWRENLSSGSFITCNGKKLKLGPKIGIERETPDCFKYFLIDNYPHYVLGVPNNRLNAFLRYDIKNREHWGVEIVRVISNIEECSSLPPISGFDKKGKCVITEYLPIDLQNYNWTSQGPVLDKKDEEIALILANHIYCMIEWKCCIPFYLKYLRRDKKGVLKATKQLSKAPEHYHVWEQICFENSKGNIYVLNYLLNVSELINHPVAKFYRAEVKEVLEKMRNDMRTAFLGPQEEKPDYYTHADWLRSYFLQLIDDCTSRVQIKKKKYDCYSQALIKRQVANRLIDYYAATPLAGMPSQDMDKIVVESFAQNFPFRMVNYSETYEAYYKEQNRKMKKNNEIAAKN